MSGVGFVVWCFFVFSCVNGAAIRQALGKKMPNSLFSFTFG